MVSKKILVGSIVATLVCLALGVACAIIRKFDILSSILLGVVVLFGIIISVTVWKEAIDQKNEKKKSLTTEDSDKK